MFRRLATFALKRLSVLWRSAGLRSFVGLRRSVAPRRSAVRIKSRVYWKMKRMEELGEIGKDTIEEYKNNNKTEEELEECKRFRLEALLKEVKIEANSNGERIPIYEALVVSRGGFCIVYKRDISETYINIYNKEWLIVWDVNMDLQFCFDFYAIITYSDYYTKDDF